MTEQLKNDAYTLANYVSQESLQSELDDCLYAKKSGDSYSQLNNVIKVIKMAIKLLN
ncbi:MAG: hypothetical protein WC549_00420 [Actinomycetota bacterium]